MISSLIEFTSTYSDHRREREREKSTGGGGEESLFPRIIYVSLFLSLSILIEEKHQKAGFEFHLYVHGFLNHCSDASCPTFLNFGLNQQNLSLLFWREALLEEKLCWRWGLLAQGFHGTYFYFNETNTLLLFNICSSLVQACWVISRGTIWRRLSSN